MIKLFTHQADPDGIGSLILTKLVKEECNFTLCKNIADLDTNLESFLTSQEPANYEQIFITDLCPSDRILQKIAQNPTLTSKIKIFDHHQSSIDEMSRDYSFVTSIVKKEGATCCGTSLYYEYLVKETKSALLKKKIICEFVEKTRLHDTWEWKEKNDVDAFHLQTLFQVLGSYGYYYHFYEKLRNQETFLYTNEEQNWIKEQEEKNQKEVESLAEDIITKTYQNYQVGIVLGNYSIRNNLATYLEEKNLDLDILMLIAVDNQTVSFRALKENVEVRSLAEFYGGGGHEKAASCPIESIKPLLLERILN